MREMKGERLSPGWVGLGVVSRAKHEKGTALTAELLSIRACSFGRGVL